jgi:hypothetical protein
LYIRNPGGFNDEEVDWYADRPQILIRSLIQMDVIHSLAEDHERLPVVAFKKRIMTSHISFPKHLQKLLRAYMMQTLNVKIIANQLQLALVLSTGGF